MKPERPAAVMAALPAALLLWAGGCPGAWATSADHQGPVDLSIQHGAPCVHVAFASPHEADEGWSLVWREGLSQQARVVWSQDTGKPAPGRLPPSGIATCAALPPGMLRPAQAYRVELNTYRLYRSDVCWRPASSAHAEPALLAVDLRTGRCTDRPWVGTDGHALSIRGWRAAWAHWWRGVFGQRTD